MSLMGKRNWSGAFRSAMSIGQTAYGGYQGARALHNRLKQATGDRKRQRIKSEPRRGPSFTKTKTKKKQKKKHSVGHEGEDYINHRITYKKSKVFGLTKVLTNVSRLSTVFAGGNSSSQGLQQFSNVRVTPTLALLSFFNTLINASANPSEQSIKFNLQQIRTEIEFQNAGPSDAEVEFWHLIHKDTESGIPTLLDAGAAWTAGLANEQSGGPATSATQPWSKPTEVKLFNIKYWSKRFTRTLRSGEKVKFNVYHNVNRHMDHTYLADNVRIRGITQEIWITQKGTVGDGTQTLTVTAANQTLTPSKIVWVGRQTVVGQILGKFPRVTQQTGTLPTGLLTLFDIPVDEGDPEDSMLATNYA